MPNGAAVQTRTRSRSASRAFRRRQIIDAAVDSISRVGFADTTLATVAKEAGISQAGLVFYFGSKDALLEETLRDLSEEYEQTWRQALAASADDPISKICTLIASDFNPKICSRKKIAAWQAFWGEVKARPTYLKICGERDSERFGAMAEACRLLPAKDRSPGVDADTLASFIDGLSDGLWQRLLVSWRPFKRRQALELAFHQLKALLPAHETTINAFERHHLNSNKRAANKKSSKS